MKTHVCSYSMNIYMRKKLPIGIDGFEKIRTNDFYYADKTMFIKEMLQNWGEVNLFTRPRRFGKSLNMSMLKCFFEIGSDPALFEGLKIVQEKDLCEKYMGKFPVISISMKSVDGLNHEAAVAALRRIIGNEACRSGFLAESGKLGQNDKELYLGLPSIDKDRVCSCQLRVTAVKDGKYLMTDDILTDSLKTLSQLLQKHYGQKVLLLIDEYDVRYDEYFGFTDAHFFD